MARLKNRNERQSPGGPHSAKILTYLGFVQLREVVAKKSYTIMFLFGEKIRVAIKPLFLPAGGSNVPPLS